MLHGRFLLINPANFGHPWTHPQIAGKFVQLLEVSHRVDLDAAIVFIAHPPAKTQSLRLVFHKPAESDSLNAPRNEPAAGLFSLAPTASPALQTLLSAPLSRGLLTASWTKLRRDPAVNGLAIRPKPCSTT